MPDDPSLSETEAKVAFLKQPASYPEQPNRVEALETHMSWLFFTDRYVYKLKKPLRYEFLDFSTVAARQRNCQDEVRLNRRLSQDVYLGTVPLTVDAECNMQLGGDGPAIDWLVKMRRLPSDQGLDRRIKSHTVSAEDIINLALILAEFYKKAPPVAIGASEYREQFEKDVETTLRELTTPGLGLSIAWIKQIATAQLEFLKDRAALFEARVQEGSIIEGHGDLRPEHIYIGPEPAIIDCLEFNRDLRILDPADELAFLAMECERLDAPFVKTVLFNTYRRITSDNPPAELVHFYMSYRASLWAKLAIRHINRQGTGARSKWINRANAYLQLADDHIRKAQ